MRHASAFARGRVKDGDVRQGVAPPARDYPHAMRRRFVLLPLASLALAACALRAPVDETQLLVNAKAVGVSPGDFFQRYGRPVTRQEEKDGTMVFDWEGGSVRMAAGPLGLEEKICRLRLTAGPNGRIASALILRDAKGERRLSRCAEIFDH